MLPKTRLREPTTDPEGLGWDKGFGCPGAHWERREQQQHLGRFPALLPQEKPQCWAGRVWAPPGFGDPGATSRSCPCSPQPAAPGSLGSSQGCSVGHRRGRGAAQAQPRPGGVGRAIPEPPGGSQGPPHLPEQLQLAQLLVVVLRVLPIILQDKLGKGSGSGVRSPPGRAEGAPTEEFYPHGQLGEWDQGTAEVGEGSSGGREGPPQPQGAAGWGHRQGRL